MIHLYDTSALLYIGENVDRPGDDYISEELNGLPVRGLRYTLEKLITHYTEYDSEVYAVMDSPTNKRELYPEYKSQRTFNKEIFVQRELLRYLLPLIGIPMISQDQFEADDLFYSFIIDLYLNKKIPVSGIAIHADDRDILGCIMSSSIHRIGLTSKTPSVFVENYIDVLSKYGYVQYNTILPYTLFYGKPSNNLSRMSSCSPADLYKSFINYTKGKFKTELLSTEAAFRRWFEYAKKEESLGEAVINEIEERIPVVFPRLNWNKNKAIVKGKFNTKVATDMLTLLREDLILKHLNLKSKTVDQVDRTLLDRWISLYRSGAVSVDNFVTADTSFFFEGEMFNGNVGGF